MIDNRIGLKLKKLRKFNNLTTTEVAKKINVSQSYVSKIENGGSIPDIYLLENYLNVMDENLSDFFSKDKENLSPDLINLISTVKNLSPEARIKLNEFLLILKNQA